MPQECVLNAVVAATIGMTRAFRREAEQVLADVPAQVIDVWPELRSAEYLVVLEFTPPVVYQQRVVRWMGALTSEVYRPAGHEGIPIFS